MYEAYISYIKVISRTMSNIYDGAFFAKIGNNFCEKAPS